MNQEQYQYIQEDKIDLRELWQVLVKRKKTIAITTLLVTVAALAYVLLVKPVYEVKSVIELAQINSKNIHDINDLKQKLDFLYKVEIKGQKVEFPVIGSITIPKKTTNILIVKAQGYDNNSAVKKIELLTNSLTVLESNKITGYIDLQKQRITQIAEDINITDQSVQTMIEKISLYENNLFDIKKKDAALAGIYAIELGEMQTEINILRKTKSELNSEKNELLFSISPINITSTKVVGNIQILDKPIKPKKTLIVVVAFITGLMLSIFLAFFLEFIQSSQREEASNS